MAKFILYEKARESNKIIDRLLKNKSIHPILSDQLKRASTSIVLNIAEGNGRWTQKDRRRFFVIARGSVEECMAILDLLVDDEVITELENNQYRQKYLELLKITTKLINKYYNMPKK